MKLICRCGAILLLENTDLGSSRKCPSCSTIILIPDNIESIPFLKQETRPQQNDADSIYKNSVKHVVGIELEDMGYGSGAIVDKSGIIITNKHVVKGAKYVKIHYWDKSVGIGRVLKAYKDHDIAFIKVEKDFDEIINVTEQKYTVGATVFAIGHPRGMKNTLTTGIISAVDREIMNSKYIQTDAAINPGNSGGPLIDKSGRMIGINTMGLQNSPGMGFAIPSETISRCISETLPSVNELLEKEICSKCGYESANKTYCDHCGTKMVEQKMPEIKPPSEDETLPAETGTNEGATQTEDEAITCGSCQKPNPPGAKHCKHCGTSLKKTEHN